MCRYWIDKEIGLDIIETYKDYKLTNQGFDYGKNKVEY